MIKRLTAAILAAILTIHCSLFTAVACPHFDETGREFFFEHSMCGTIQSMVYDEGDVLLFRDFPAGSLTHDPATSGIIVGQTFITPESLLIRERAHFSVFSEWNEINRIDSASVIRDSYELVIGMTNTYDEVLEHRVISDDDRVRTMGLGFEVTVRIPTATAEWRYYHEVAGNAAAELGLSLASFEVFDIRANIYVYDFRFNNPPLSITEFYDPIIVRLDTDRVAADVFAVNIENPSVLIPAFWNRERGKYEFVAAESGIYILVTDNKREGVSRRVVQQNCDSCEVEKRFFVTALTELFQTIAKIHICEVKNRKKFFHKTY
jgi:hypothetical protein